MLTQYVIVRPIRPTTLIFSKNKINRGTKNMLLKISRVWYALFLVILVGIMFAQASVAEVNDDYALKISLENQLERKLKQVIMEITGTDRVVIFVNTELISARGDSDKLLEKRKG